ncbi:metal ABC transporter ATP-binding protein [Cerasibacillus sp. JNUCC 74]
MKNVIGLDNVTFGYNKNVVIKNLSFSIQLGQFVAIVGENGAAKTTSMKLLLGILKPWRGQRVMTRNARLAYIPQEISSIEEDFPSTVFEFVLSGVWTVKKWYNKISKSDRQKTINLLHHFGLKEFKSYPIGKLSGGQKQKACVARALMSNPTILLLDEPTIGMDHDTRKSFYLLLKSLCPTVTVIIISHQWEELKNYVDQTILLERRRECV